MVGLAQFPRVTLVMPAYRHRNSICSAVDSVFEAFRFTGRQDKCSLVVIADGDYECANAIRRMDPGMSRVYLEEFCENRGIAAALNRGHDIAIRFHDAEVLGWVSADNILRPEYITTLVHRLCSYSEDYTALTPANGRRFAYGRYERTHCTWCKDSARVVHARSVAPHGEPYTPGRLIESTECGWIGPAFLYTRGLWNMVGEHRPGPAHDYDWLLRAEEVTGERFLYTDEVLVDYSVHQERESVRRAGEARACALKYQQAAIRRREGHDE